MKDLGEIRVEIDKIDKKSPFDKEVLLKAKKCISGL